MTQIIENTSPRKPPDNPEAMRALFLSALRCGRLRALLLANEIDAVGIALSNELVPLDTAYDWVDEIGAWPFLNPEIGQEGGPR